MSWVVPVPDERVWGWGLVRVVDTILVERTSVRSQTGPGGTTTTPPMGVGPSVTTRRTTGTVVPGTTSVRVRVEPLSGTRPENDGTVVVPVGRSLREPQGKEGRGLGIGKPICVRVRRFKSLYELKPPRDSRTDSGMSRKKW